MLILNHSHLRSAYPNTLKLSSQRSYSTIAWTTSVNKGVQPDVQYGYKSKSATGTMFNFFTALGDVAFAYAGHNVVLEIQATIPSTPEKPSKGPMWRGVVVAYIVVALCYFPVALIGYWMYGNAVSDNILISLNKPTWLIAMANLFIVVHIIGSYQIYAMPVFDMIETVLVKKLNFPPSFLLRFITRNIYVALTMFIGICFPFFGGTTSSNVPKIEHHIHLSLSCSENTNVTFVPTRKTSNVVSKDMFD